MIADDFALLHRQHPCVYGEECDDTDECGGCSAWRRALLRIEAAFASDEWDDSQDRVRREYLSAARNATVRALAAEADAAEVRKALRRYAQHDLSCVHRALIYSTANREPVFVCTCGLDAALALVGSDAVSSSKEEPG